MHKEDIKAAIRREHGTVLKFEENHGLPAGSVKDVLRGRSSARTEGAIAALLKKPMHKVFPRRYGIKSSTKGDDTRQGRDAHRLTCGAN
ncbi:helix-turn-helix domain-containing protein [Brevundimonas faecalis]|uniref:helix-turn-helix domain-containing protein n=1 Tax=Brevundimonas faecalis TaxID=947378 RepID=UPI003622D842